MRWYEIEGGKCQSVVFNNKLKQDDLDVPCVATSVRKNGGIMKNGEWIWIYYGSSLEIFCLQNGQQICYYNFANCAYLDASTIISVNEIQEYVGNKSEENLLAICLQNSMSDISNVETCNETNTILVVYSVLNNSILSYLQLNMQATYAHFIKKRIYEGTLLHQFNGSLAVGSSQGVVQLVNLQVQKTLSNMKPKEYNYHTHLLNMEISANLLDLQRRISDNLNCAVQLQGLHSTALSCISSIDEIKALVLGMKDGSIALYNLQNLQYTHLLIPPVQQRKVPIIHFSAMLKNDLHSHIYVWAVYKTNLAVTAVLHEFDFAVYARKADNILINNLQELEVCSELELDDTNCNLTACEAFSVTSASYNENVFSPCIFGWCSESTKTNKLLVFDLNQWFKEGRPCFLHRKTDTKCLAGYVVKHPRDSIGVYVDTTSICYFNSKQRSFQHFNPNCVSFTFQLLENNGCHKYIWEGAQNKLIQILRTSNASIFLETERYYDEILQTNLQPILGDYNCSPTKKKSTLDTKYECLLSVLLENNCYNVLRDCVIYWTDGNFCSNLGSSSGLSLSVIIKWISKRSILLERQCNNLYKHLLHKSSTSTQQSEIKEIEILLRQLKLLSDLTCEIIDRHGKREPEILKTTLTKKMEDLNASILYHRVSIWLYNIGLLNNKSQSENVPKFDYNFKELQLFYNQRRSHFANLCIDHMSPRKTTSLLFIDNYIQQECDNCDKLAQQWQEDGGNGLYPPASINIMLQMLLIPEINYDCKCTILLYFFLDLNLMIERSALFKDKVDQFVNFPTVFLLRPSLTKTVQIFWCLDRGFLPPTLDEFIPLIKQTQQKKWLLELLMQILLSQDAAYLALRILQVCAQNISPIIILRIHLANDMIPEAFQIARMENSDTLLELFFSYCITAGKFGVIRNLALCKREGIILQKTLKNSKAYCADNLQFIYLLSKSKFIEALAYMDELSHRSQTRNKKPETSHIVLSAFNTTMAPMTQGLTDTYFRIHNKIKKKEIENTTPVPMSCQLIKQNANSLLGGIYHSSVLSAHFATYYWGDINKRTPLSNDVPFLGKPQLETYTHYIDNGNRMTYPKVFRKSSKRSLDTLKSDNVELFEDNAATLPNAKRRRFTTKNNIDFDYMGINTVKPLSEVVVAQNVISQENLNQNMYTKRSPEKNLSESLQPKFLAKLNNSPNRIQHASSTRNVNNREIVLGVSPRGKEEIELSPRRKEEMEVSPRGKEGIEVTPRGKEVMELSPRQKEGIEVTPRGKEEMEVSPRGKEEIKVSPRGKEEMHLASNQKSSVKCQAVVALQESNIEEFKPMVCSSKMFDLQTKFVTENDAINLSDTTTVGELTFDNVSEDANLQKSIGNENNTVVDKPKELLETTLGMSDWENGISLKKLCRSGIHDFNLNEKSESKENSQNIHIIIDDDSDSCQDENEKNSNLDSSIASPAHTILGEEKGEVENEIVQNQTVQPVEEAVDDNTQNSENKQISDDMIEISESSIETNIRKTSRHKRGISVPPQVADDGKDNLSTPRFHRATSLQPSTDLPEDILDASGSDILPASNIYAEDLLVNQVDSPSRNTRSRTRYNSEEKELLTLRFKVNSVSDFLQASKTTNRRTKAKTEPDDNSSTSSRSRYKTRSSDNLGKTDVYKKTNKVSSSMENVSTTKIKPPLKRRVTRQQVKVMQKDSDSGDGVAKSSEKSHSKHSSLVRENVLLLDPIKENEIDDETVSVTSIASSTRSQRRTKEKRTVLTLSAIPENETQTLAGSKSRTRKKK